MPSQDFIVRVDDLGSKLDVKRLTGQIQAAVMRELATIDFGGPLATHLPHAWNGLVVRKPGPDEPEEYPSLTVSP